MVEAPQVMVEGHQFKFTRRWLKFNDLNSPGDG